MWCYLVTIIPPKQWYIDCPVPICLVLFPPFVMNLFLEMCVFCLGILYPECLLFLLSEFFGYSFSSVFLMSLNVFVCFGFRYFNFCTCDQISNQSQQIFLFFFIFIESKFNSLHFWLHTFSY